MTGSALELATQVARYLEWLRDRAYSSQTIAGLRLRLQRFVAWCSERDIRFPEDLTQAVIEGYQRHLAHHRKADGSPLATPTQEGYLVAVRGLCRWLVRSKLVGYNPAADLVLPRRSDRVPRGVLTPAEAERVLATPDVGDLLGLRDRAMLEMLYSTGMRRSEVARLLIRDVDLDRGVALVREGKSRKDRTVPVGQRALAWLERYLADARPLLMVPPDDGEVFLTRHGRPFVPNGVSELVTRVVKASGISKRVSAHAFRHTAATVMLEGGADVRYIQEMLGHSSLSTTQVYTRVSITALKQVHDRTHPGARLAPRDRTLPPDLDDGPRIRLDEGADETEDDPEREC